MQGVCHHGSDASIHLEYNLYWTGLMEKRQCGVGSKMLVINHGEKWSNLILLSALMYFGFFPFRRNKKYFTY